MGKIIKVVFEEGAPVHDGISFDVRLEGLSKSRVEEIMAMCPEHQMQELSTAEFWALRCFQITVGVMVKQKLMTVEQAQKLLFIKGDPLS